MGIVLLTVLTLEALVGVACSPGEEGRKVEIKRPEISAMHYSLDLSVQISNSMYISEHKRIDCDIYRDITVKTGIIVKEIYDGDNEIWRAERNRELMKLIVIQRRKNTTYIVMTKDRAERMTETYIIVSKVALTFTHYKDCEYNLLAYPEDPRVPKSNNLRPGKKAAENEDNAVVRDPKAPFQSKEYMSQILPEFVTRPKFREMDEDEKNKSEMK